jgi:hypothetical protein
MKLRSPYVWKSGLAALGVLSLVSFQSVSAQTATTTPSSGSTSVTTPAAGNATTGDQTTEQPGDADNGNANGGMPGANWGNGKGDQHDGRFNGGMKGPGGMMGGVVFQGRGKFRVGVAGVDPQAIADFLGLTTEQVKADLDAGQSLAQIAVAQGKTRDELKAFLVAQATTAIDAAIDATPTTKSNEAGTTTGGANATPAAGSTTAPSAASTPTS